MSDTAIVVNDLHKRYDLGAINSGTFSNDLKIMWARLRGQNDPTQIIGEEKAGKEYWALKGLDFEIKKGESVGIIGKNGAGKSTLLKILSRVTAPTRGEIRINGRIASLLEVGTGFHPDLTGRENIFMNGAILGMTRHEIARKLDEIIAFSGVEKYIDTPVKRYSSGMYVRLAFAVAAHLESEILIVDEVLAVGDAEFQKKCLGKMNDVSSKDGRTVLYVSHQLSTVLALCTKAILLRNGRLVSLGKSNNVVEEYISESSNYKYVYNGDSCVFFDNLELRDYSGKPRRDYFAGEAISISFEFIVKDWPSTIEISIDIHNKYDELMAHISNYDDEKLNLNDLDRSQNKFSFNIKIHNVNFSPGGMKISLWAGSSHGNTYIYANNCMSFNIHQNNDLIKRSNDYPSHAKTILASIWTVE